MDQHLRNGEFETVPHHALPTHQYSAGINHGLDVEDLLDGLLIGQPFK